MTHNGVAVLAAALVALTLAGDVLLTMTGHQVPALFASVGTAAIAIFSQLALARRANAEKLAGRVMVAALSATPATPSSSSSTTSPAAAAIPTPKEGTPKPPPPAAP